MTEAEQTEEKKEEEAKEEMKTDPSEIGKNAPASSHGKRSLLSPLKFWKRSGEAAPASNNWNDLDFGVFWIVALLLFFAGMGVWPLVAWAIVFFALKTWIMKE